MASIIRIKRSTVNGNPSTLGAGELAYSGTGAGSSSNGEDRLYIGLGTETAGNAANHLVIGGKYFTDMMDHTQGVLTANSALLVDSDKKLDNLKVDNLDFNGNTISSTDSNGNIIIDPDGTGYLSIVGTNGVVIPVGTTLQRGPSVQGTIRYNTTTSSFEGYSGTTWGSLGGVKSVDGLTYITAESSPGASDDTLSFVTDGTERFFIDTDSAEFDSTVVLRVDNTTQATSTSTGSIVTAGGMGIAKNLYVGGNLDVAGTMQFTGSTNFDGTVTITGSDTAATEYFIVQNASGDDKFVVDSANGNTTIAGTLTVNGVSVTGALGIGGDLTTNSNLVVDGNTTLGDASTDTLTVNAKIASDLLVNSDGAYDLGDTTNRWASLFVDAATITNNTTIGGTLGVTGNTTVGGTFGVTGATTLSSTLAVTGATTLSSTLGVTGESTLASATISDLTSGRVVLAGTSGAIEDSANLTFNGSALSVTGTISVSSNATVGGTLGVTGATTLSSTLAVTGNQTNSGTLTVTGATALNGGLTMDTNKFTVADGTGNTTIAGTLSVAGATTIGASGTEVAVAVDATTLSLDAKDTTNLTMTANSSSTKTLGIDASNAGTGAANITVGSTNTDNVIIDSATKTQIDSDTEVEINTALVDVNATGAVNIDSGSTVTTTATTSVVTNADTITLRGTAGAGNNAAVGITGSLDVDNIKIDGNTISTTDGSNTLYLDPNPAGSQGTVVIEGNLQVNGTQTTINSTTVTIDDPIFVLGGDAAPSADDNLDRGIEFQWHDGTSAKVGFFGYDDSAQEFVFIQDATDTSSVLSGDLGAAGFGSVRVADTTASTSTTTGAVRVAGGVGIAGQLNVGGATSKFTSTTASSSTTTGALVVAGGVGIGEDIYVAQDIIGSGAATSMIDGFEIDGGTY